MMIQQAIILVLFIVAAGYISWKMWKSFAGSKDGGCAKGCGCAADKAGTLKTEMKNVQ